MDIAARTARLADRIRTRMNADATVRQNAARKKLVNMRRQINRDGV